MGTMGQAVGSVRKGARKVLGRNPKDEKPERVIVMAESQHHLMYVTAEQVAPLMAAVG